MLRKTILMLLVAVMLVSTSYGWGGRGHMVVAAVAYSQLSEKQRKNVVDLLQYHPEYKKWQVLYEGHEDDLDFGMFLMMQASMWPDKIRNGRHSEHGYDRPEWHYVTYKMRFPNKHETILPDPKKEPNVVWAIEQAKKNINDATLSKKERAMSLAWLIHLIGDIHQPLHCGSVFSNTYPDGDRGGNKFWVMPKSAGVKLHSLWDGALGTSENYRSVKNQGTTLRNDFPKAKVNTKFAPAAWSIESFNLAVNNVHLKGKLKGADEKENAPELPEGYTEDMKELASKRAAWAGYRLGKTVEDLHITSFRGHEE